MLDGDDKTVIVPEFFFELIARIIPGLVVLAISIYWSNGDFKMIYSNAGLLLGVLLAAWIIGVTLDDGVYMGWKLFPQRLREWFVHDLSGWWMVVRELEPSERKLYVKGMAQIIFLRSMTVICVLTMFICIGMYCSAYLRDVVRWDSFLPALHDHYKRYGYVCFFFALVFGRCWWMRRSDLEHFMVNPRRESLESWRL